ncbi:MAG: hypothetical protein ACO32I_05325 [Candidatus Limnocylindrus sp.]|jgi:hypothetical protein
MSRDLTTFVYSAVAGALAAITYLIAQEIKYAEAQQRRALEDARTRYAAAQQHNG